MRLALVLVLAACGSEGDDEPTCADRGTAALAYEHVDGNGTYAGTACVVAGCHLEGSPGPAFHAAGTVMHRDRVTPQDGVTVRFRSQTTGGILTSAITDTAGNFFIRATEPSPFPGIPEVTACPDTEAMVGGTPNADYASCAAQTCHDRTGRGPITLD
jgi:hypothetical protein